MKLPNVTKLWAWFGILTFILFVLGLVSIAFLAMMIYVCLFGGAALALLSGVVKIVAWFKKSSLPKTNREEVGDALSSEQEERVQKFRELLKRQNMENG